jgi:coenzyme F420-0:L-glutamate ligase / coenzyme F420-1:gamma-L-glutamate ligase
MGMAGGVDAEAMLREARIARLATADPNGQPHVVPVCFASDGTAIFIVIDEKPKRTAPQRLRRVRNIIANPKVAMIVDHYEEDWRRLRYTLVTGTARVIESGPDHIRAIALLREKYPQYRTMRLEDRPVVVISPAGTIAWAAEG